MQATAFGLAKLFESAHIIFRPASSTKLVGAIFFEDLVDVRISRGRERLLCSTGLRRLGSIVVLEIRRVYFELAGLRRARLTLIQVGIGLWRLLIGVGRIRLIFLRIAILLVRTSIVLGAIEVTFAVTCL